MRSSVRLGSGRTCIPLGAELLRAVVDLAMGSMRYLNATPASLKQDSVHAVHAGVASVATPARRTRRFSPTPLNLTSTFAPLLRELWRSSHDLVIESAHYRSDTARELTF